VYHSPTRTSGHQHVAGGFAQEQAGRLTQINGDSKIVRNVVFSYIDDTLRWFPLSPLLLRIVRPPRFAFVFFAKNSFRRHPNYIGVGVDSGEFGGIRQSKREEFALDLLEVGRVVEEELEEDRRCGEQVIWLSVSSTGSSISAQCRLTRPKSHFFSRSTLMRVPSNRFNSHSSTIVSEPGWGQLCRAPMRNGLASCGVADIIRRRRGRVWVRVEGSGLV